MEEENGDQMSSGEDSSMQDEEMDDGQLQIEARELQQGILEEEKNGTSMKDIQELWDSSQPLIREPQEGISLYTTYIYLLRRMGASVDELKQVFLKGQSVLSELFGDDWDEVSTYRRNYAYFLYTKAKQPEEALNVWKDILASGFDSDQYSWIEAVRLERHFGSVENARALLYQGVNAKLDDSYDFLQYFIQFEREEGTRAQVDAALQKINSVSRTARNKPPQQKKRNEKTEKPANKKATKRKVDNQSEADQFKKVVKVSDDPQPSKTEDKPPSDPPKVRFADSEEKTKLFVRNVEFKTTKEQLETFFGQFGEIKEVRIVHHKNGKPKGFAYVEYFDEESAQKGLAAHQQTFNGRTLQVHISDPSIGKRQTADERNAAMESKPGTGQAKPNANKKAVEPNPTVLGGGQTKRTGLTLKPRIVLNK